MSQERETPRMPEEPEICGHCQRPIHPSDPRDYCGTFTAHRWSRCVELLQEELAASQAEAQRERERANASVAQNALEQETTNIALKRAEQAERRAAELERDARRYRWLAGNAPQHSSRWQRWKLEFWSGFHGGWQPLTDTELDAAIDAAIAREGGEDE